MPLIENIYHVRNADNASVLQPDSIGYAHTDEQLREALKTARECSLSGMLQLVIDLAQDPEIVIVRFEDGARI